MNSAMSGLAVLKKPFTWKFGNSKGQKKMSLQFETESEFLSSENHPTLGVADPEARAAAYRQRTPISRTLSAGEVTWDFCASAATSTSNEDICLVEGRRQASASALAPSFLPSLPDDGGSVSDGERSQDSRSSWDSRDSRSSDAEIYCTISESTGPAASQTTYQNSFANGESTAPLYENAGYSFPRQLGQLGQLGQPAQPTYANTGVVCPTSPVIGAERPRRRAESPDLEEHIYEDVYCSTDSIYQVPFAHPVCFQGLTEELRAVHLDQDHLNGHHKELVFELPDHLIYSSVVKPKRRKQRPALSTMLELHNHKGDKVTLNVGSEMHSSQATTASNGTIEDNQIKNTVNGSGLLSVNECADDSASVIYENVQVKEMERVITTDDLASVIEISDDGTWETKELPPTEIDQAKEEHQQLASNGESSGEFFEANRFPETVKIKHAAMAYGSQYYVNTYCPVASVKPMKNETSVVDVVTDAAGAQGTEDDRNIGAQIMRQYEQEREKLKASRNLPEVSLLDVEASIEDIAKERRRIIVKQAVKAKRFDSWIRDGDSQDQEESAELSEDSIDFLVHQEESARRTADLLCSETGGCSELLGPEGEVVCDSILQNKHKTKTYWEQMMMMAAASVEPPKPAYRTVTVQSAPISVVVTAPTTPKRDIFAVELADENPACRSDASEQGDFFDARSQISLESPVGGVLDGESGVGPKIVEAVAKKSVEVENIKLVNTGEGSVIARDIRIQKEKEDNFNRDREKSFVAKPLGENTTVHESLRPTAMATATATATGTPTLAETKIAMELREMREREEELRSLRQSLTQAAVRKEVAAEGEAEVETEVEVTALTDDTFNSIPNTDEGNYSEYGSEEKELSLDGNNSSRMMSPEVPSPSLGLSPAPGNFLHQRTQSMDSMSSGHSSGSGSGPTDTYHSHNHNNSHNHSHNHSQTQNHSQNHSHNHTGGRRRITVKPYEEPAEDEKQEKPSYMRSLKETPIEREIRLAGEREEELRREKRASALSGAGLGAGQGQSPAGKPDTRRPHQDAIMNDPRSVQHRLATNRIQQEINEATERENELRSAGTIQTTSEDTLDSKVTRFTDLAEYSIEEQDRKQLQRAASTPHLPSEPSDHSAPAARSPATLGVGIGGLGLAPRRSNLSRSISTNILSGSPSSPVGSAPSSGRRFGPSGQRGIMERFLASRGKLVSSSFGSSSSGSPVLSLAGSSVHASSHASSHTLGRSPRAGVRSGSPVSAPRPEAPAAVAPAASSTPKPSIDVTPIDQRQATLESDEKDRERATPLRKGYTSAEDKIQAELQEMRRREEELRLQRARMFARSQPNLLSIGDGDDDDGDADDGVAEPMSGDDFNTPMSIGGLRASLSNPNLLDSNDLDADMDDATEKPSIKITRKRNSLIAQWENRIQQFTAEH